MREKEDSPTKLTSMKLELLGYRFKEEAT